MLNANEMPLHIHPDEKSCIVLNEVPPEVDVCTARGCNILACVWCAVTSKLGSGVSVASKLRSAVHVVRV